MSQECEDLLTEDEHTAIRLAGELYTHVTSNVIQQGGTQAGDTNELAAHIHSIQHMVMAQAAARKYPERYRLLGRLGEWRTDG